MKGQGLVPETYKSRGLTPSAEAGYNWRVGSLLSSAGMENRVWLQPHAQVIWSGVRADYHTEASGTRVQGAGNDNVQTKLGLRVYLNGKSAKDKDTGREFQPFIEANWLYNTQTDGIRMNGGGSGIAGDRNVGELKAGVEGKVSRELSLWTAVAQQMGGSGYHDTEGMLGVKYSF